MHLSFIGIATALILLNALFVAAEFGLVKIRATQMVELDYLCGFQEKVLKQMYANLDVYLSACQLGITFASLGLGWIGEPAFTQIIEPLLVYLPALSAAWLKTISLILSFMLITFLHIVVGELAPKSLAIRHAQKTVLWTAFPLYAFYWLFYPLIKFLNSCAFIILRLVGSSESNELEAGYSAEELRLIISKSYSDRQLKDQELLILENTLDFSDLQVADLMRPIDDMSALHVTDSKEIILAQITQTRYSRYPVYDTRKDKIIGIVHVKDLFLYLQTKRAFDLKKLIRPVLLVAPELPVSELFKKFKEGPSHFAIINTCYNHPIGFITLDHMLWALLGNIHDEFNQTQHDWLKLSDGSYLMKGSTPLFAVEKALNIELADTKAHTINGLITETLERLPAVKEQIEFEAFSVIIREMKGHYIASVRVVPQHH